MTLREVFGEKFRRTSRSTPDLQNVNAVLELLHDFFAGGREDLRDDARKEGLKSSGPDQLPEASIPRKDIDTYSSAHIAHHVMEALTELTVRHATTFFKAADDLVLRLGSKSDKLGLGSKSVDERNVRSVEHVFPCVGVVKHNLTVP